MFGKSTAILLSGLAAVASVQAAVTTNFSSTVDPTKITLPSIPQTTSHDPTTECQDYESTYNFVPTEWPTMWTTATSNGMTATKEFLAAYNSIDWTKAPNIAVRKKTAEGGLDMTGYNAQTDPDCWWSTSLCVKPKAAGVNADISACNEPETWGLTYDDGPNCSHNAFYDFLQQNNQKASMFYIGSNVMKWPYGALRGVKDGHHLCGHTWSHQLMTSLTNQEVFAELYYTQKAIKFVTGVTPKYWRPAQGDIDDRVRWIATQLDLTAILWNLDTDDWAANVIAGITPDTVNKNYDDFITMGTNGTFTKTGNIVLSHEINNMTMGFAMDHYPAIKKAYKHVVDVATCMNITNPYFEKAPTFPTFDQYLNGGSNTNSNTGAGVTPAANGGSKPSTSAARGSVVFDSALFIAALFGVLVFV